MIQLAIKTDAVLNDTSFREFRKFVNSLRCPLCGSQLDGSLHPKEARLYCVSNNDEYSAKWNPDSEIPVLEQIKYYYPEYEYVISISKSGEYFWTQITRYNSNVIPYYKNSTRKVVFSFKGDRLPFFRKRMEEDVFLNKLKLYNVFS